MGCQARFWILSLRDRPMMRAFAVSVALVLTLVQFSSPAIAQTSYPMLMSIKPVAAQVGTASEHEIHSRYDMFGAYKVMVTGEGVTGEVTTPMTVKPGEKKPVLSKIMVKFTVTPEALPGVRDVKIATPNGVSTVAQLVIAGDPIVSEVAMNDTLDKAQVIPVPVTLCGCIEKAEDVDFFKFKVDAGTALSFHVRSQRLQNRIHDLQIHSDPLMTIRTATGSTLAQSDNVFAGDPFLNYKFEQAGEYILEVRDVRYQGNIYWEYSVEITNRPFVASVFPMGVTRGQETKLRMIGYQLPADPMASLTLPMETKPGPQTIKLPMGGGTAAVPVVVSDLPLVLEAEGDNNTVEKGQLVTIPCGINGRIETDNDIDYYTFEAKKGELVAVEVIARRQGSPLDPTVRITNDKNGTFAENDDGRFLRITLPDSWIETWTCPADGKYAVEIRDLHLRGGDGFVYYIKVTRPEPYFLLETDTDKTLITPGTCAPLFVRVTRKNGFTGAVQLKVDGLPPGVTATCGRILEGKGMDGCIVLEAAPDAPQGAVNITISGTATHKLAEDKTVELSAVADSLQEIYMPGGGRAHYPVEDCTLSVGAPGDIRKLTLSSYEINLKPGESQAIDVIIERAPEYTQNITLDVIYQHLGAIFGNSLPEGVTIDGKLSKTLLTGKESTAKIVFTATKEAPPVEKQQISMMAHISLNFVMKATYGSKPLLVTVQKP
jgi:hypothetical protein